MTQLLPRMGWGMVFQILSPDAYRSGPDCDTGRMSLGAAITDDCGRHVTMQGELDSKRYQF
ncbi:MAG: hypothetical protein ABW110_20960 [Steroidobacteraceae bacterium]